MEKTRMYLDQVHDRVLCGRHAAASGIEPANLPEYHGTHTGCEACGGKEDRIVLPAMTESDVRLLIEALDILARDTDRRMDGAPWALLDAIRPVRRQAEKLRDRLHAHLPDLED